jgi:predicted TIM-barrel fold metal-dependent hydrolase
MLRVWDCHVHAYPPEVHVDAAAWAERHGEWWWSSCVAPAGRTSLQGWADDARLVSDMDKAGIERCVLLGWYWENQETCEEQNRWYVDWVRKHPDRLVGFAAANPKAGQRTLDDVNRSLDEGLRGIGELLPQAQGYTFRDEGWEKLVELSVSRKVPINLHVSDPALAGAASSKPTPLEDFVGLGRDNPEATFILAHWGGGLPFHELSPKVAGALRNVYYDAAASPLLYDKSVFRRTADLIGADRILFGTDYPLLTHPRKTRDPSFELSLADARNSGLTEAELDKILGGNVRRLLKLP